MARETQTYLRQPSACRVNESHDLRCHPSLVRQPLSVDKYHGNHRPHIREDRSPSIHPWRLLKIGSWTDQKSSQLRDFQKDIAVTRTRNSILNHQRKSSQTSSWYDKRIFIFWIARRSKPGSIWSCPKSWHSVFCSSTVTHVRSMNIGGSLALHVPERSESYNAVRISTAKFTWGSWLRTPSTAALIKESKLRKHSG